MDMEKERIMTIVSQHPSAVRFFSKLYNHLSLRNRLRAKGVKLKLGVTKLDGLKIHSYGTNNEIVLEDFVRVRDSSISIYGSNNRIVIKQFAFLNQVGLWMEDDNNLIQIGEHTSLMGSAQLAAIEGTSITIGEDCLFSSELHFRTGDSHSITDLDNNRINPSQDIVIGNHVWVGTRVICLKNVRVSDNSVVAAGTILSKQYELPNCVIGGVPGRVVKQGINWTRERLPVSGP